MVSELILAGVPVRAHEENRMIHGSGIGAGAGHRYGESYACGRGEGWGTHNGDGLLWGFGSGQGTGGQGNPGACLGSFEPEDVEVLLWCLT